MEELKVPPKDKDRIKKFFVYVGDQGSESYKTELERLSECIMQYLYKNPEGSPIRNLITGELANCVAYMSGKWKIYSTFFYLISIGSNDYNAFIETSYDCILAKLSIELKNMNSYAIMNIMRFLAESVNLGLFYHFPFLSILNEFINIAETLDEKTKAEALLLVVKTLPFVAGTLVVKCEMEFKNFLGELDRILKARTILDVQSAWYTTTGQVQNDALDVYHKISLYFVENKKNCGILNIGFDGLVDDKKTVKAIRKNYDLSCLKEAKATKSTLAKLYPEILDQVFQIDPEGLQENGGNLEQKYDLLILRDVVFDLINSLKTILSTLSTKLLYFSFNLKSFKTYEIVVDFILNALTKNSTPKEDLVFASSLCKNLMDDELVKAPFTKLLEVKMGRFYQNIGKFNIEVIERFVAFFSLLKTNTSIGLEWAQNDASCDKESEIYRKFCKTEILRQLVQLSIHEECIKDDTLAPIIDFLPEEPKAILPCADSFNENHSSYQTIIDKFSSKVSGEEMKNFLENNEILKMYNGDLSLFFIKSLLYHTRHSTQYLIVYTERYESILREYCSKGRQFQYNVLNSIVEVWRHSSFNLSYSVHHMYKKELIPPITVTNWLVEKLAETDADLSLNKVFMDILKKILRIISANKSRFESKANDKLVEVIAKLKKDYNDLLLHITTELINKLKEQKNEAKKKNLLTERIICLIYEFWKQDNELTPNLETLINQSEQETLKTKYSNVKAIFV